MDDTRNPFNPTYDDSDYRREELITKIEQSIARLTLPELESLYYNMITQNFIAD